LDSLRAEVESTKVASGSARDTGALVVRLRGRERGRTQELLLSGDERCRAAGWIVRHALRAQVVLRDGDVEQVTDWLPPAAARAGRVPAAGRYTRRAYTRGEWISEADLGDPPLVRRGEALRVLYASTGFHLQGIGVARADGWEGDLVVARLEGATRDCRGIVTGPGQIEVREPGGNP